MVSATYRIELRQDPHSTLLPWDAVVIRLSDDKHMTTTFGKTANEAVREARTWIWEEDQASAPSDAEYASLYVDDQGRDAEAPQSVKV